MQDKRLGRSRSAYRLRPTSNGQARGRSEEHTSELQSLRHLVCRLLLEKKKKKLNTQEESYNETNTTDNPHDARLDRLSINQHARASARHIYTSALATAHNLEPHTRDHT